MFDCVALVGATGAVGRIVLDELLAREFPMGKLRLLASSRSVGKKVTFGDEVLTVELLSPDAFEDVDLVIASTPDEVSAEFAPWA
ncbi:MAG: aspartate-semialdehyde dehydrogenase, partial [Planctomycetota bacterium]